MTILESLTALSNYPIGIAYAESCLAKEGLDGSSPYSQSMARDARYLRAKRQICLYLATAPDVSQGGISYKLDANARGYFIDMASDIAAELSEDESGRFGYIGDEL